MLELNDVATVSYIVYVVGLGQVVAIVLLAMMQLSYINIGCTDK